MEYSDHHLGGGKPMVRWMAEGIPYLEKGAGKGHAESCADHG
jgi:hypothetical protein